MSDTAVSFTVDGKTYTLRPEEITAALAGEFRRATGMSVRAVLAQFDEDMDIDLVAAVVWLARRQSGDKVIYQVVADAITYSTDFEANEETEPEDPDSPEA